MTISFFQVGAIHSYYESLVEADFLGCGLKFEAADLENLIVDKPKILDFAPSTLSILCPLGSELFEQSAHSYFQVVASYPMTSPLRC